jgi:N-acetylglutamate synthase-like GNAT family acetyltransferase
MKVVAPQTPGDFVRYYALRFDVLRKPWNQPPGSEKDELEPTAIHAMIVSDEGEVVGVCRMQYNSSEEAQLRYMGIRDDCQGKGIGNLLIAHFETMARAAGKKRMVLEAREKAVTFYERNGYSVLAKSYLLWLIIHNYIL